MTLCHSSNRILIKFNSTVVWSVSYSSKYYLIFITKDITQCLKHVLSRSEEARDDSQTSGVRIGSVSSTLCCLLLTPHGWPLASVHSIPCSFSASCLLCACSSLSWGMGMGKFYGEEGVPYYLKNNIRRWVNQ